MRTATAMPLFANVSTVFKRSAGVGAFGSIILAMSPLSVVIVMATVACVSLRISVSLVTIVLLVMTWIRQLLLARIFRHSRVSPAWFSICGYGSDEFDSEIVSPFSFAASRSKRFRRSFFGLHSAKWGM